MIPGVYEFLKNREMNQYDAANDCWGCGVLNKNHKTARFVAVVAVPSFALALNRL
jgi:hypothetical protein